MIRAVNAHINANFSENAINLINSHPHTGFFNSNNLRSLTESLGFTRLFFGASDVPRLLCVVVDGPTWCRSCRVYEEFSDGVSAAVNGVNIPSDPRDSAYSELRDRPAHDITVHFSPSLCCSAHTPYHITRRQQPEILGLHSYTYLAD